MRLLPLITLAACALAIAERWKRRHLELHAGDLHDQLDQAQVRLLQAQHATVLLRSTSNLLRLALAQAQAREAARQQLHQASGWHPQPDRPAWHRDHPQESPD